MYEYKDHTFIFKVVLVGDSVMGKTNFQNRFIRNEFTLREQSTIGVEIATKSVKVAYKPGLLIGKSQWTQIIFCPNQHFP